MVDCTRCFAECSPRFTAHNCLPLRRRRFGKYDSFILICLGKHKPNADATLHAWANRCRCCLIISPTCTLNCEQWFQSHPRRPPISAALINGCYAEPSSCCFGPVLLPKKDNTCPVLNGNSVDSVGWYARVVAVWKKTNKEVAAFTGENPRACGDQCSSRTIHCSALFA